MKRSLPVAALLILLSGRAVAAPPAPSASAPAATARVALSTIREQMRRELTADLLPFWTRYTPAPDGGFNTVVDRFGRPKNADRYTVMQARMVWTLCAARRFGVTNAKYLTLARRCAHHMTATMWDRKFGGFYMETTASGTPIDPDKYLYIQEFALYGLSEYARDTPSPAERAWALGWCAKIFDLIQSRCADPVYGGYREDFDREWKLLPDSLGVGGVPSGKTLNTHMHLLEAFTNLVLARPRPRYVAALRRLDTLLVAKVIAPNGSAMEPFDMAWKPVPDGHGQFSTFYGHDVEFAWMLLWAAQALHEPQSSVRTVAIGLIDEALADGYDHLRGGIAGIGPRYGKVAQSHPTYEGAALQKDWWEQAEALTAFITAYRITGDPTYLADFEQQWRWVSTNQIDHFAGDWFTDVTWDRGLPTVLDKGLNGWKVCYHDGRAMMRCAREITLTLGGPDATAGGG